MSEYPTADAYEAVCKALYEHKGRASSLAKALALYGEVFCALADPEHQAHHQTKEGVKDNDWLQLQILYIRKRLESTGFNYYGDPV